MVLMCTDTTDPFLPCIPLWEVAVDQWYLWYL